MKLLVRRFKESGKWNTDDELEIDNTQAYNTRAYVLSLYKNNPQDMEILLDLNNDGNFLPIGLVKKEDF